MTLRISKRLKSAPKKLFLIVAGQLIFTNLAAAQVAYPGHVYTKAPDGSVQDQSTPQQNQVLSTVAISANTNTAVYTPTNTPPYPRVVRIIPLLSSGGSNTTCAMNDTPGAATATSTPIPGGYVYNLTEPSPSNVVDLYCTTGGYVSVEVGY